MTEVIAAGQTLSGFIAQDAVAAEASDAPAARIDGAHKTHALRGVSRGVQSAAASRRHRRQTRPRRATRRPSQSSRVDWAPSNSQLPASRPRFRRAHRWQQRRLRCHLEQQLGRGLPRFWSEFLRLNRCRSRLRERVVDAAPQIRACRRSVPHRHFSAGHTSLAHAGAARQNPSRMFLPACVDSRERSPE